MNMRRYIAFFWLRYGENYEHGSGGWDNVVYRDGELLTSDDLFEMEVYIRQLCRKHADDIPPKAHIVDLLTGKIVRKLYNFPEDE